MIPKLVDVSQKQHSSRLQELIKELGDKLNAVVFPEQLDGWRVEHVVDFAMTNLEQFQLQQELIASGWKCTIKCLSMDKDLITVFIPL